MPIPEPPPVPLTDANLGKFIGMLRERHKPIEKYFDKTGVGEKLLTEDSQLMEKMLLHFAERGIAVLPIHDSLVIGVHHAEEGLHVMNSEFKKMFGQDITIDGSVIEAITDAMERIAVLQRSEEWNELEAEITYQSKVDFNR